MNQTAFHLPRFITKSLLILQKAAFTDREKNAVPKLKIGGSSNSSRIGRTAGFKKKILTASFRRPRNATSGNGGEL